jgi:hypothetical protein
MYLVYEFFLEVFEVKVKKSKTMGSKESKLALVLAITALVGGGGM